MAQRDSMHIMLHGQMGQESVAEKTFSKDSRRSSGESAVTAATVALLQFIADDLFTDWLYVNNGTRFSALGVHGAAAEGAPLRPRHRLLACDLLVGNLPAAMAAMTGLGAASALRVLGRRVGFVRYFG